MKNLIIKAVLIIGIKMICLSSISSQWTVQHYDTNYTLTDINFINPNTGFAVGEKADVINIIFRGVIYKTTNSGQNWNLVFLDSNILLRDSYFTNDLTGYAVGGFYSVDPKMLKTTNGGNNWSYVDVSEIAFAITQIIFFNQTAFLTTISGLYKSTNGGNNWIGVLGYFNASSASSHFINQNTGWCFGRLGNTYKTTNGGLNWTQIILDYYFPHKVQFVNSNTGFLICDTTMLWENSKMLKTTNGGINWFELNPAIGNHRWSLHFVNLNTGYISGDFGEVIKTTDGGTSWNSSTTGTSLHLMDIKFIDAYTGYACGGSSIIIKTTSGGFIGIPPISTQVPKDFMLYQNYPNPFNPTTTIKFAIPKAGFVKLAVYDMLGREVKTLVNESLGAGNYEVKFNSANLSSGIYFYKLITGDFTEVKKMSLIK